MAHWQCGWVILQQLLFSMAQCTAWAGSGVNVPAAAVQGWIQALEPQWDAAAQSCSSPLCTAPVTNARAWAGWS